MKILILANNDVGLFKFRKELLERLLKDGNEVLISLPFGSFVEDMTKMGCTFIETPIQRRGTNPITDLKLLKRYDEMIRKYQPDTVLSYTIKPNVYGGLACQKNRIPYIANVTGLGSAVENGGLMQKITVFLYRMGLRKADTVFFQNEANRDFMIRQGVVKDNYRLIPGSGVNLNQYSYMPYPVHETIDFVYVGRLMKEKGFDLYASAAEKIRKEYPYTRFHVCGDYEDNYKERVEELVKNDVIIYHGLVDKMTDIYEKIDCTIHPTYYPEGMSNVLLESLACGRPIITTDRPGCREIVDDKVNGFVVRQNDEEDLVEKIRIFIGLSAEERKQLGLNGRKKVEEQFDRNIVINEYLRAIEKAVK
ncbi:MAG: glycosyltransferase family 4 protein [Erysipelotrichaceae bacterium]|nr:glycosyltransferase family 4 protein [Erysipelotrichaceae bacterium]